jgi:hypothetical protein
VKWTCRPKRCSTRMNHRVDRKAPAATPPTVTAVASRRTTLADATAIAAASPAAEAANIAVHSQVASWKNRSRPA